MPLKESIKKVLVIGSGPIVIGQAAEFDYAGTQACRALKEDGIEIVLVNSNPATIMTDSAMADRVYIEPLTLTTIKRIIEKEISGIPTAAEVHPSGSGGVLRKGAVELHIQKDLFSAVFRLLAGHRQRSGKGDRREIPADPAAGQQHKGSSQKDHSFRP